MRFDIRAKALDITGELREYVARRLSFALGRHADHVRRIDIALEDVNGPRGGVDKACRIHVTLDGAGSLHVRELQADVHTAVDRSADRIGHLIAQKLTRAIKTQRKRRTVAALSPDFVPLPA
jgi:ribosomal subunit interface protein